MDFGSAICVRDKPLCEKCPLQKECLFFPLYKQQAEKVLFVAEKKQEKGMTEKGKFIPNRIFRGRILELVRQNDGKEFIIVDFGKKIKLDYTSSEEEWLLSLCKKLKKEGFLDYFLFEQKIILRLL